MWVYDDPDLQISGFQVLQECKFAEMWDYFSSLFLNERLYGSLNSSSTEMTVPRCIKVQ